MPNHTCDKCGKSFASKTDLSRHIDKKNPCIYVENISKLLNDKKKDNFLFENEKYVKDDEELLLYEKEFKRLQIELKDEVYLYVYNALESNIKLKKFYEDTVSKLFLKLFSQCKKKINKNGDKEEYKRDWDLFDKGKVKSNDLVKKKLFLIFQEN